MFLAKQYQLLIICWVFACFGISCQNYSQPDVPVERVQTIASTTDMIIGSEDQPLEYQLGRPIAVRTDEKGNIYIADRASKQIKVFDEEGNHLKNLGGRGRGPGEFQDMELMEITPEENLVIIDRGMLQYTVISPKGEFVEAWPYNLSDQFYPHSIILCRRTDACAFFRIIFSIQNSSIKSRYVSYLQSGFSGKESFIYAI